MASEGGYLEDEPLWYKDAVMYELPVRTFYDSKGNGIGDFKGLTSKLDYLADLGVTAIWLLPFYPSPMKDDGYDIAEYFDVHPQYGKLKDFKKFLREAHKRGIRVIIELVLNHTSEQHPWFQKSRKSKPGSVWREFYLWSDTSDKYHEARIIFKDFESSNWTWDPIAKAFYWHRFYSHQPDLNYDSPRVQKAMLQVKDFWLRLGVDGLRLDAVPYLFERESTNCENLPETHSFLKKLRSFVDANFKNRMLLAEANQWPSDAVTYMGNGDECHMAFHFPLMPRMFMAIQLEDNFPIIDILDNTPTIPENCQWALFLRNHDELTLEMVTDEERDYMYRVYAKDKHARINLGIRRRLAPLLGNDRKKIELMNILLFTLPGTPVIYYGDEIGMGDNYSLGDRNGVRTPMQWSADINAGFSKANPQKLYLPVIIDPEYHYEAVNVENQLRNQYSLLWWMKKIIILRKRFKAFGRGTIRFLLPDNNKIFAFIRQYGDEQILVATNLSRHPQVAQLDLSTWEGQIPQEVFGGTRFPPIGKLSYTLTFDPYGYYIFLIHKSADAVVHHVDAKPELRLEKGVQDLFRGRAKEQLESLILPTFVKTRRWFGGKAKEVEMLKIRDVFTLENHNTNSFEIIVLDIYYNEGLPEAYLLPIAFALGEAAERVSRTHPQAVIARVTLGGNKGVIYDGVFDEQFRSSLFRLIARKKTVKGSLGELVCTPRDRFRRLGHPEHLEITSHIMGSEQSNTSIVYDDKFILKLFRHVEEGSNPELEIGDCLAKSDFKNAPLLLADIRFLERGIEPTVMATLQEFVRNKGDSWKFCLNELAKYFNRILKTRKGLPKTSLPSFLDMAETGIPKSFEQRVGEGFLNLVRLLGKRTGEFHLALAAHKNEPDFAPEPFDYLYQLALSQSMISYAKRVLYSASRAKMVQEDVRRELENLLLHQEVLFNHFKALRQKRLDSLKIRIHGDYHLGQVLFTGTDFVIIDFEGEPSRSLSERRLKRTPLRDIAGMIRSFHYAVHTALLNTEVTTKNAAKLAAWADIWYRCVSAAFLRSYLDTVAGVGIVPSDKEGLGLLLNALLIEKAIYELGYELNNRPSWAGIPIKGIKDILGIPHVS